MRRKDNYVCPPWLSALTWASRKPQQMDDIFRITKMVSRVWLHLNMTMRKLQEVGARQPCF
jgi:hypothetical protein